MQRIADYALIGDGRSAALLSRSGSLDWLCWPRFDSPPLFAALLDPRAGCWHLAPTSPARISRRYLDGTNVLVTRFDCASGHVVLTDLMTVASEEDKQRVPMPDHEILRHLACERGEVELEIVVDPQPDFGRTRMEVSVHPTLGVRWMLGARLLALRGDVALTLDDDGRAIATFRMRAGDAISFSLTFDGDGPATLPPLGPHAQQRIERSIAWWRGWSARARYAGPQRDAVLRSALAIKLMGYAPSGAIVAAPTTSLPERAGGPFNWDYRFCWLRDASFTARALLSLGYTEDADAFVSWLLHSTRLTRPALDVIYDVYGNTPMPERELVGLTGFAGSRPVRTGNAVYKQLQLDLYGEVIDAAAQLAQAVGALDHVEQRLLRELGDYVCAHWQLPDQGIWEPRGRPEHRTHSRLMCWVAVDRLLDLHARGLLERVDVAKLLAHRAAIRADIEAHAWDRTQQAYTSAFGNPELDASVLLMSWYGFHPASAPRMRSTYARVAARLEAGPGLLYRYEASLRKDEGAFWLCSFWAVEHLALGGGTLAEAQELFDAACSYANDVGLMSEEVERGTGELLGNFPQAYTHVGLISAALSLVERSRQAPWRIVTARPKELRP